jgi:hypothetical protein
MAKLDLSKQGLQRFFLSHSEKLVIGLCAVGLAVLAWTGWKTPSFRDDTPGGLSTKATRDAEEYLNRPDSWDSIQAFRKMPSDPLTEVSRKTDLDATLFTMDSLVGPMVKTADLRKDPALVQLQQPMVHSFTAPVLLVPSSGISRLGDLPLASGGAAPPPGTGGGGDIGRGGGAPGVGGAGGGTGDGAGDGGRGGGAGAGAQDPVADGDQRIPGKMATEIHRREFVGVRGFASGARGEAFLRDVCQVTATIDAAELSRLYQENFENARAWYPDRDKPAFYRVQVEIVMDGQTAANDITDRVHIQIPKQYGVGEPSAEVISPENFDLKAAPPLPPITGYDYRQLMTFAGQPLRLLKPDDLFADVEVETEKPRGELFQVTEGEPAKTEDEGTPLNWLFGNDSSGYTTDKLEKKLIVVRILDLDPPTSGSFKYRIRVWLEDPNNTRDELVAGARYFTSHYMPAQAAAQQLGGGAGALGGVGSGGGAGDGAGDGGRGGGQGGQQGDDPDEDDEPKIEYQPVEESDLDPLVRIRLREQRAKRKKMIDDAAAAPASANPSPARDVWQTFCRPTEWVETGSITVNPAANRGEVALGGVREAKPAKINNFEIPKDEPVAQLLGSSWSSTLGAWVPGYRPEGFRRGEALNYSVHRLKKDENEDDDLNLELRVKTDHVVIDVLGGREIPVRSPMPLEFTGQKDVRPWTMPGEVLVMDSTGKLVLHNEFDDLQDYRNGLFLADETASFGRVRTTPAAEEPGQPNR